MNRRSFLGACLALGVAPAIVRADSLMRVVPRDLSIIADLSPELTPAIARPALVDGAAVWIRFTCDGAMSRFYESYDGNVWREIGHAIQVGNGAAFHSPALGLDVSAISHPGEVRDTRICMDRSLAHGTSLFSNPTGGVWTLDSR